MKLIFCTIVEETQISRDNFQSESKPIGNHMNELYYHKLSYQIINIRQGNFYKTKQWVKNLQFENPSFGLTTFLFYIIKGTLTGIHESSWESWCFKVLISYYDSWVVKNVPQLTPKIKNEILEMAKLNSRFTSNEQSKAIKWHFFLRTTRLFYNLTFFENYKTLYLWAYLNIIFMKWIYTYTSQFRSHKYNWLTFPSSKIILRKKDYFLKLKIVLFSSTYLITKVTTTSTSL